MVEICRRSSSNNNNNNKNTRRAVKLRVRDRRSQDVAVSYRKWRYDDCDDETKVIFCQWIRHTSGRYRAPVIVSRRRLGIITEQLNNKKKSTKWTTISVVGNIYYLYSVNKPFKIYDLSTRNCSKVSGVDLYTEWFIKHVHSPSFFYFIKVLLKLCLEFLNILIETIFSNPRNFLYYQRNVLWRYKLLFFKQKPLPLCYYKSFDGYFFLKCLCI